MQKHVNLADLVKSFQTSICLQILASIQPRTSPVKFARSPKKSPGERHSAIERWREEYPPPVPASGPKAQAIPTAALLDRANLTGLVLGCIEAKFCRKICV